MLDDKGFDLWADGYDKSVELSEENDEYPFAGYRDVLNELYKRIHRWKGGKILDIGFGTGILTKKLYDDGYDISGIDFSEKMLEIAKEKMPEANLIRHDIRENLPKYILDQEFDFIISSYAMHHLNNDEKLRTLKELKSCLGLGGQIIIGDIAFETMDLLKKCSLDYEDYWDDEEIYFVFEDFKDNFRGENISFTPISHCSAIIELKY